MAMIIELEQNVKFKAAHIRKEYNLKLPDAIIAATAEVYELIVITRNVQDFNKVKTIKTINPWDL